MRWGVLWLALCQLGPRVVAAQLPLYIPDPGLDRNVADLDYVFAQRRLTLLDGSFELHASLDYIDLPDELMRRSLLTIATTLAYAVTDRVEVGTATTFVIRPEADWGKVFVPRVTLSVIEGEWSDLAFNLDTVVDFEDGAQVLESRFGAPFRVRHGDFIVITGFNAFTWSYEAERMILQGNLALGYQLSESSAIRLDTQLFRIGVKNAQGAVLFGTATPLGISYFLSTSPSQDLNVTLALPDIADGFDFYTVSVNSLSRF